MTTQVRLSPTAIENMKACPERFRLNQIERLHKIEDTESQRNGTNWHALMEIYRGARASGVDHEAALDAAIAHLNERYARVPDGFDRASWEAERAVLAYSFIGYLWYYAEDRLETLHTEIKFELPLMNPSTRMPLPTAEVVRTGRIDSIVALDGRSMTYEYKSTTRDIAPGSDYWRNLEIGTQARFYPLAARDLGYSDVGATMFDVWRRPGISPKKLSKADTEAFLASGEYCGQIFVTRTALGDGGQNAIFIDGAQAEVEILKTGFAIRETSDMFGARLLADIMERPEHYFQRREIAALDTELDAHERELYGIYQTIRTLIRTGYWWKNEHACEATYKCEYCGVCYARANAAVYAGETPAGYRRAATAAPASANLTIEGRRR